MANQADNPTAQVLIVDDQTDHAEVMAEALSRLGHVCTSVHDLQAARDELKHGRFDLVVTDLKMQGDQDGMAVLAEARQTQPYAKTILVTAHSDVPTCKAALKQGAYDFIEKPLDLDIFRTLCTHAINEVLLQNQNIQLKEQVSGQYNLEGFIGASPAIQQVLATIRQVAPSDIAVLVTGESGTGKELVAQALHNHSLRAKKIFKPLNCAGLSESILESELFGHVRGAFTGAERDRQGVFEYADGGTLFLDEIGDMPLTMQAKLLRVLESGELVRVGSNEPKHVDVRLISATNHDLAKLTKEGKFREDLYFRIRGAHIHLAPLRERREDVPLLVRYYVEHFAAKMNKEISGISEDAILQLMKFDWPGNVRQLINVVQGVVLACQGNQVALEDLPLEVRSTASDSSITTMGSLAGMSLEQIEKQAIRNALHIHSGNREAAAAMLGIGERTLYRRLKDFGLK